MQRWRAFELFIVVRQKFFFLHTLRAWSSFQVESEIKTFLLSSRKRFQLVIARLYPSVRNEKLGRGKNPHRLKTRKIIFSKKHEQNFLFFVTRKCAMFNYSPLECMYVKNLSVHLFRTSYDASFHAAHYALIARFELINYFSMWRLMKSCVCDLPTTLQLVDSCSQR